MWGDYAAYPKWCDAIDFDDDLVFFANRTAGVHIDFGSGDGTIVLAHEAKVDCLSEAGIPSIRFVRASGRRFLGKGAGFYQQERYQQNVKRL